MTIAFFGTGEIGLPSLRWLFQSQHEVCAVVTQPDKPVGRKQTPTAPMVKQLAMEYGIPVFQPEKIRKSESLGDLQADVFVVVAYGQILPAWVLERPRLACINLHASFLPNFRGASPIQAAILHGDRQTAMTVMHVDAGLDTGDVILSEPVDIAEDETGGSLHDKLALAGPAALEKALTLLASGHAPRQPQDHAHATHTRKLTREHGRIDWTQPASLVDRLVRAYHPWPGTSSQLSTEGVKLFPPTLVLAHRDSAARPGEILGLKDGFLLVACGSGAVGIAAWQMEGRTRLGAAEFLRGRPGLPGQLLH